jgi:hypothetical protein
MRLKNFTLLTGLLFLGIFSATFASAAHADVRVGGSSLLVNGHVVPGFQYTGTCPVDLEFHFGVIGTSPASVAYTFSRSDGGHSNAPQMMNLPSANRSMPIIDHWNLGANNAQFANYSGWVQLNIQSPNPVTYKIPFTIHCAGPTVRVGGSSLLVGGQIARGFQYTGSCPADLEFHFGVIGTGPTPVTYTFTRNDGGHSNSTQTIDLPNGNQSVPIIDHWRLGANSPQFASYSGWVQLDIQSPNVVTYKIPFTLHCR